MHIMNKKSIKAIAFDIFGTLIQPRRSRAGLLRQLEGVKPAARRELRDQLMRGQVEVPVHAQVLAAMEGDKLFPDALTVVCEARRRGLRVACISNLASPYVASIDRLLPGAFHVRVLSCEVGYAKLDTQIYLILAERLGLAPAQILIVGDSREKDFEAPLQLGFQALWLDREERGDGIRSLKEIWQ